MFAEPTVRARLLWIAALVAGLVVLLTLITGAVATWRGTQVRSALDEARADAHSLREALDNGDSTAAARSQRRLLADARRAEDASYGTSWDLAMHAPVVGDDLRAIRTLTAGAVSIARDGAPPVILLSEARRDLEPRRGQFDLVGIERLKAPAARADSVFGNVRENLDSIDDANLTGPVSRALTDVRSDVSSAADILRTTRILTQVLPTLLGADGDRTYLVVVQNLAESRATGGLGGAVLRITARQGAIALDRQSPGNILRTRSSVASETAAESALFGPTLARDFRDSNLTPDFRRAASFWAGIWTARTGERVDGVIAADPVVLAALLRVTGAIRVDGVSVRTDNAVRTLLADVYSRIPDPAEQDEFFRMVAATVMGRILGDRVSAGSLIDVLRQGVGQHRVLFRSFDADVTAAIDGQTITGALPNQSTKHPFVGLYRNDGSGSKLSYFLRTQQSVRSVACRGGRQTLSVTQTLTSSLTRAEAQAMPDYPAGSFKRRGLPKGTYVLYVVAYGPVGGSVDSLSVDDTKIHALERVVDGGREVVQTALLVDPGSTTRLRWTMRSGPGQSAAPALSVSPGVTVTDSQVGASACH